MPGFRYFAPVTTAPTLDDVRAWGLGYAFSAQPEGRAVEGATPSGAKGYVFADSKRLAGRGVRLDKGDVWRKIPGRDGLQELWVGYWADARPTPEDLARPNQLSGYLCKMADGHEWRVPVVRAFDEDSGRPVPLLPRIYDLDERGELTLGEVAAAHQWLWDLTEAPWNAMMTGGELSHQSFLQVACKLLGANYAVDVVELAAMCRVFSPQTSPVGIVALAIDFTTWTEWAEAKKKTMSSPSPTDGGCSTPPGETAGDDATPRPALTS